MFPDNKKYKFTALKKYIYNSYFFLDGRTNLILSLNKKVPKKILKKSKSQKVETNILLMTYNISGINPLENSDMLEPIYIEIDNQGADILVIGF